MNIAMGGAIFAAAGSVPKTDVVSRARSSAREATAAPCVTVTPFSGGNLSGVFGLSHLRRMSAKVFRVKQEQTRAEELDLEIGARVRLLRKLRGMSQTDLGESIGVTFQQVQKYERGTNRISTSALILLARALDVSPGALLGVDKSREIDLSLLSDDGAYEFAQAISQIRSSEHRQIIVTLAGGLAGAGRLET